MSEVAEKIEASSLTVEEAPVVFSQNSAVVAALKVDSSRITRNGRLVIEGWSVGNMSLVVFQGERRLTARIANYPRADVAETLKVEEPEAGLGFRLETRLLGAAGEAPLEIKADVGRGAEVCQFAFPLTPERLDGETPEQMVKPTGFIESSLACSATGDAVVVGWIISSSDTLTWLENESGEQFPLEEHSFRYDRRDVWDAYGEAYGCAARNAAFIARIHGVHVGERVNLVSEFGGRRQILSTGGSTALPINPLGAAKSLFGVSVPLGEFQRRVEQIDRPILDRLLQIQQSAWPALEIQSRQLGTPPAAPEVSVIVPLYGRTDFVEHQLIEFSRDPWFKRNAELLYVVDDPSLLESFFSGRSALPPLSNAVPLDLGRGKSRIFGGKQSGCRAQHSTLSGVPE